MGSPVRTPGIETEPVPIGDRWQTDEGSTWSITTEPDQARDRSRDD